ncbi:hypothetical protein OG402_41205 [Streptomyces anulatus]|uniref:hypothetical protein n=1 Tax=Streptomyces anulatus TaxID=1892 RepID=UPI002258DC98|nr:hypothetical protein [Streptomyces anulatus]MCX4606848.1 hypothetical protein [Streptomyces anulatus]
MAHWNLDVSLRGQGTSLARTLRTNAGHARTLARATSDAEREVRRLGATSLTAATSIASVGRASDAARGRLQRMARQARNGARDLRDLARAAADAERNLNRAVRDIRITAHLDDNTTTGRASLRAALAEIQALSPVRIRVDFDGDPAQIAATAAALRDIHSNADRTNSALGGLTNQSAAAAMALRAAEGAARDLARALRTLRVRAEAAANALDDIGARATAAAAGFRTLGSATGDANTNLTTLSGSTRTLRSDMDDLDGTLTRVTGRLGGLSGSLGTVSTTSSGTTGNMRNLAVAAAALGTALIPIAAATAPIAAGLTASGAAIGAFGLAVAGQIVALAEATEAEQKYQDAVDEHGKSSEEAAKAEAEYLRTLADMPPATRESAAALAVLKDEYTDWSNALAGDTMPVVTKSMGLFRALLPHTTSLVKGTSKELDRLLNVAAGGMTTPGFDRFIKTFTAFATGALARGTTHLTGFIQALDTGEVGADLREFMAYARENGPLVGDTLMNLAKAVITLLVAASDMGVSVLTAVNALAQLVNAIPPEALSAFIQLYAVMKLATLGMTAMGAVAGGAALANVTAFGRSLMFGGVRPAIGGVVQGMSGLQKAAVGLGVLGVVAIGLDMLTDKVRDAPPDVDKMTSSLARFADSGQAAGEMARVFGKDLSGLVDTLTVMSATGKGADFFAAFEKSPVNLKEAKKEFEAIDKSLASLVTGGKADLAAAGLARIKAMMEAAGKPTAGLKNRLTEYKEALAAAAFEEQLAADGMGLFGQQAQATQKKLDAQKASTDGLRQSIVALNETNRTALGGMIGFEASIDAAAKSAKENAGALKMVNGELDLNSPKAQAAATDLTNIAAKADEAATAAREQGRSWEYVNGIYKRGEQSIVSLGQKMGLTKDQAQAFAATMLTIPEKKVSTIEMRREDAIAGLDAVIAKIKATPGNKSVTVKALTSDAVSLLNSLGYKTKTLPGGRVQVTANTGSALSGLYAVKSARDSLTDKTLTITTHYRVTGTGAAQQARRSGAHGTQLANAEGSVVDYYADGGIRNGGHGSVSFYAGGGTEPGDRANQHIAQIAPAGSWRVWGEPETSGEGYVPFRRSARPRSRAITEEIVRRLGGDPAAIQWNADGNVTDWRYDPTSGSLYSPTDAGQAGHKTKKVKVKGKNGKTTTKDVEYFSLAAVEKQLKANSKATKVWNKDLEKVADRVGGDVADALAAMGKDGVALAKKMATGSTKYINEMAAALRGLSATAKASLTDYTRQLDKATGADSAFTRNLATLAARGYGDLAKQLAAQGDTAAQQLAASAVADNKKAGKANTAAKKANTALTGDEVDQLIAIIAAIKTNKTGIHNVADTTGLGEDAIIATATKAQVQIKSSLGARSAKFIADLARANRGLSYANGGIREGIYSTRGGAVTFAEPSTGGEAYIPLGAAKRGPATNVLRDVASRFGVGLTDATSSRPMVIVREGGDTNVTVHTVRTGASASDIGAQVGRSVRRARRGGVSARAAA